eukprot:TRINITY_DN10686_c0_g1_i2.p1 TRINITY_DN10686_c0_g1~~TRINITY_DN10686_c0_g1_i2.p1  ORF type:complete len:159 (-),score=29.82 TRINITY_DN10686_c0_g1_i2:43-519(-)
MIIEEDVPLTVDISTQIEQQDNNTDKTWPISVRFIVVSEFCERFGFYGLKTILPFYLHDFLGFTEDTSTMIIHAWVFFAYSTCVLGGLLADSYLGKFKTIVYFSIIYIFGSTALSIFSIPGITGDPPHAWGAFLALFLVGLGTGGTPNDNRRRCASHC